MKFLPQGLLLAFLLFALDTGIARAETKTLSESVRISPGAESSIVRTTLSQDELQAPMTLSVALRMRDFSELQARIAAGEKIPWVEMDAKYRPLQGDYERIMGWLEQQGFQVTLRDTAHTNVVVRGSVERIGVAFGVRMARVAVSGREYTAATNAPSLPAEFADRVVGIIGLQPQMQLRHTRASSALPQDLVGASALVTPDDVARAYHIPNGVDGSGQTIAILADDTVPMSDLTSFWSTTGVTQSTSNVTVIAASNTTVNGDQYEASLDLEWAGALAPGAKIRQYVNSDVFANLATILSDLPANPTITVVSSSYSEPEANLSAASILSYTQTLAQLAAAGVSVFVDSADAGSNSVSGGYGDYSPTAPLYVAYPCTDPDVTAVGGTQLDFDANWTDVGETAWSDLTTTHSATGGGVSTLFQKPVWQTGGAMLASQNMRCVPDVAAISVGLAESIPQGTGPVASGEIFSFIVVDGKETSIAGTSLATPVWAAIAALINEARAKAGHPPLGLLGPNIYPLTGTPAFTDILTGSNGAYSAGPGFDLCTGLGSPNVANLIQALAGVPEGAVSFSPSLPLVGAAVTAPGTAVASGSSVTLSVSSVTSTLGPVTYQWTFNGIAIPGATSSAYTLSSVQGGNRGTYAIEVTNDVGTLTVPMGQLTVVAPIVTVSMAAPSSASPGTSVLMSVSATSSGGNLTYQWSFNGTPIPAATQASLLVSDITAANAGDYSVLVTDSNGYTATDVGTLTLDGPNYLTPYVITTLPGGSGTLEGVAVDRLGTLYVSDPVQNVIRKVSTDGTVILVAGIPGVAGSADGQALSATFNLPRRITVDASGNLYVSDTGNATIRMITPAGAVSTLAGTAGVLGSADGQGAAASFFYPLGLTVDASGVIYVADFNNDTIRVIRPGGIVSTLAGSPKQAGVVDGTGPAARFSTPMDVAVDVLGNIYVADGFNGAIRKVTQAGVVTTLAGKPGAPGTAGVKGDTDGTGTDALFTQPEGVAVGPDGNIYVCDTPNYTLRRVTPEGVTSTLAGSPGVQGSTDGEGPVALFSGPEGIAVGPDGTLYVADGALRKGIVAASAAPAILTQPVSQTVATGTTATFTVVPVGTATFQWADNGTAIAGATSSVLVISDATSADAGSYTCTLTNSLGTVTTVPAALAVVSTANPGRLINLSCRAQVGSGSNVLIVGFATGGPGASGAQPVLVRASGPALIPLGVMGVLPDPVLDLHQGSATVDSNSGWQGTASLTALFSEVGAFSWTNPLSHDSALSEALASGAYSAVIAGASDDTGVALAEVYDATPPGSYTPSSPRLVNLSARVDAGTGGNTLIAGFVIGGTTSKTVLIRASGPALGAFGITGTLAEPKLDVRSAGMLIASNTGWGANPQIAATAGSVGAFSWGAAPTADSAVLLTLPPGAYTAEVSGADGGTGVALVEVYEVP